jgi:DNA-binding transcriptional ArsR family regulator
MATMPRVLDLVGGTRGTPVEVTATPVAELIIGLETFQFTEAVHTFEVGPDWLDRARLVAGPAVLTALARLSRIDWGLLLSAAIAERWPLEIGGFIERVVAMPDEDLWLLLAGHHLRPFADAAGPETFFHAARGDQAARERLADADRKQSRGTKAKSGIWDLSAPEAHRLTAQVLRGWYRDVFAPRALEATKVLERDARAKQRLRRTVSDEALVEAATNGLVYVPEPWVRRIVLTPHIAMRPWNVTCAHDDTYVICYPVADDSLGVDPGAPPASLVRFHKALADERRLRILHLLARSDLNLAELSEAVGLAKSTTHHHTVILRSAGLIRSSTATENRYSLRREAVDEAGSALRDFLEAARR